MTLAAALRVFVGSLGGALCRAVVAAMAFCFGVGGAFAQVNAERLVPIHTERWFGWESLGGATVSGVECVATQANRLDCFASGNGGAISRTSWDGQRWTTSPLAGRALFHLDSRPECVSAAADHIDCFVRSGDDPTPLFQRVIHGSFMTGWIPLGGGLTSDPDCVARSADRLECFAAGPNRALVHSVFDGDMWSSWAPRGATLMQISKPSCVLFRGEANCIIASDPQNSLRHFRFSPAGVVSLDMQGGILQLPGVSSLGPKCYVSTDPDPNSHLDDQIHCFAPRVGTSQSMLARWTWNGQGNWSLSDLGENFGFGDWDCVVRSSQRIDCVELALQGSASSPTGYRLRHRQFRLGQGVSVTDVNLPPAGSGVPRFIRCVSWAADRLDCFASGGGAPLLHAWFALEPALPVLQSPRPIRRPGS
jgi:hypothetical protein